MPQKSKSNNKSNKGPLPAPAAIHQLIRISQSLMNLAERETQALLRNDMLAFAIMQHEKEKLANDYMIASESFRSRIEEFRSSDPGLLNRLEKLQRDLTEKMKGNNTIVERMRIRTLAGANKNLEIVRNFGTSKRVRFKQEPPQSFESNEGVQT